MTCMFVSDRLVWLLQKLLTNVSIFMNNHILQRMVKKTFSDQLVSAQECFVDEREVREHSTEWLE